MLSIFPSIYVTIPLALPIATEQIAFIAERDSFRYLSVPSTLSSDRRQTMSRGHGETGCRMGQRSFVVKKNSKAKAIRNAHKRKGLWGTQPRSQGLSSTQPPIFYNISTISTMHCWQIYSRGNPLLIFITFRVDYFITFCTNVIIFCVSINFHGGDYYIFWRYK